MALSCDSHDTVPNNSLFVNIVLGWFQVLHNPSYLVLGRHIVFQSWISRTYEGKEYYKLCS